MFLNYKEEEMKLKIIAIILSCLLVLSIAGWSFSSNSNSTEKENSKQSQSLDTAIELLDESIMFTDRDLEIAYEEKEYTDIQLENQSITIDKEGVYRLSGTMTNGQVIVDAEKTDKIQLILDGVNIQCNSSAAIYVKEADKVFITLAPNSKNTLTVSGDYESDDNNIDAVLFSKSDITLNGEGSLTVNTEYGNGITSKDDLVIASGNYIISSGEHGLEANDSVRIADGTLNITSGKDGIHGENAEDSSLGFVYIANGDFLINSVTDGISASGILQIVDGNFDITSGGGSQNASTTRIEEVPPNMGNGEHFNPPNSKMQEGKQPPRKQDFEKPKESPDGISGATISTTREAATSTATEETTSAKGIKSAGNLIIINGDFHLDASDDSLHSNTNVHIDGGVFEIASGDDGIHADAQVLISSGSINITKSYEGIEGQSIEIQGGTIQLVASDDGFNSAGGVDQSEMGGPTAKDGFHADENCYIKIAGGNIHINASGDGVDSNGNLIVTGGETFVSGPTNNGNGAIDYNGTAQITGGIFVASGSSGMAQNFGDSSTQGSILVNTETAQAAKSSIILKDKDGNILLTYIPENEYSSVVVSSAEVKKGENYTISLDTETKEVNMTDIIYSDKEGGFNGPRR